MLSAALADSSLRSHNMRLVPFRVSLCQVPDSSIFMLTLWDLSDLQDATPTICLQSLIDSLAVQNYPGGWLHCSNMAQAFLSGLIASFGVLASFTSDRGRQFISELWWDVLHLFGIKPIKTTSYHLQANGMVERMHRQLKAILKARLTTVAWCTQLPIVCLGMRNALKEDLDTSAAELVYGTNLHLPGDFINQAPQMTSPVSFADQLRQHMTQLRPSPVITHGQRAFDVPCDQQSATLFFLACCQSLPTSVTMWWTNPCPPQVWQILQGGSWLTYR